MATFAKQAFNSAKYSAIRPTYPRSLYDFIYQYHAQGPEPEWQVAIDLGCGTGQATVELTAFKEVIGVDPSDSMITKANKLMEASPPTNTIKYIKNKAEELSFISTESVDLVIAAQAAHWFDYSKLWPELARILRRDGCVAFWGYSQFRIAGHPSLTPLIYEYSQGKDPRESIGPYWEQPGRSILDNHFLDIPNAPESQFKDHQLIFWTGDYHPSLPASRPTILRKTVSWEGLQAYLRTFSALYTYQEACPEDSKQFTNLSHRPDSGKGGDVVERFWWKLKERVAEEKGGSEEEEIVIEWPLTLLLCRRM
ncbi:S-adenosyl-L-methionine-dependent methyltransferase [Hysterangium stoloniferum]|nr:S-adenosyl-L-methionine-dependent methyltransferase [Hysterangium stoloniferum]